MITLFIEELFMNFDILKMFYLPPGQPIDRDQGSATRRKASLSAPLTMDLDSPVVR